MPTKKEVLATTNIIDGIRFTRESLVDAAANINGEKATRLNLEHDAHYMPLGKVRAAEVMDLGEKAALVGICDDTHAASVAMHKPTGNQFVEVTFPNDDRPFAQDHAGWFKAPLTIVVDQANFDGMEKLEEFLSATDNQEEEATSLMSRRSLGPEPLIQFAISDAALIGILAWLTMRGEKFLRYTVDETARKLGDAISDKVSERLKKWLGVYNDRRSNDDREVTSHIVINVEPQIHLLTRSHEIERCTHVGIDSLCRQMELHKDLLLEDADSVTFARTGHQDEWKFLYITTKSGKVITTEDCYKATVKRQGDVGRTIPICLCLKHKKTKQERHYETTAIATKLDESGRFRFKFNSFPPDIEDYELIQISLLLEEKGD